MADRLLPYELSRSEPRGHDLEIDDELLERAVRLLKFIPRNQPRERVEHMISPTDPAKGRRAVDALVDAELATVDARGRLQRNA